MCCLFGLFDYDHRLKSWEKGHIIRTLAAASEARGTDAAGIAYNACGQLHIYKRPGCAHKLCFRVPGSARVVMGHTRLTTQGSAGRNRNNHPFLGHVPGATFALAHNGVLWNDRLLRKSRHLPKSKIETDSYVAVQLLEQQKALTPASLKAMAESVEGSFVFTVLDDRDNLYFVRGDNPLCLLQFPQLGIYLYASTKPILQSALGKLGLAEESFKEIPTVQGEILQITPDGARLSTYFRCAQDTWGSGWFSVYEDMPVRLPNAFAPSPHHYLHQLKTVAASYGYSEEDIDALLKEGWSTDEIEEAIYHCGRLF